MRASKGFQRRTIPYLTSHALESLYLGGLVSGLWSLIGEYEKRENRRKENVQTACTSWRGG